jgi:sulfatase modifying factor 1
MAENANWQKPDGKTMAANNHPVTQVSYADAQAYCHWTGGRLPSAAEWDKFTQETFTEGNIWQGQFPTYDYGTDGFKTTTAPIGSFRATHNGLYDLFGNVWEWTSTIEQLKKEQIIKGGSFLCEQSVCAGYVQENYQTTPAT